MATPTYTVTPISNRTEYGTVSQPVTGTAGTVALLTATAKSNGTFLCWSDGSTENPHRYSIPAKDVVIKAYFYQKNPVKYLLDLAGLTRFWTKIKEWFSDTASRETSGAKQIGFCNTSTTYISNNAQDALEEIKLQSDNSDAEISLVKRTYMPLPEYSYVISQAGTTTFVQVSSNDSYSPYQVYYLDRDINNIVNFYPQKCTDRTYSADEFYWQLTTDPVSEDNIYIRWTGTQESFEASKNNLYHLDASGIGNWETYVNSQRLFTGTPSGASSMEWRTETEFAQSAQHPEWNGSMPHSGIMTVDSGRNNHIFIVDTTINKTWWNAGRDRFGTGNELITFPVIKGHGYRVKAEHTNHGGGSLGSIVLFFFGD